MHCQLILALDMKTIPYGHTVDQCTQLSTANGFVSEEQFNWIRWPIKDSSVGIAFLMESFPQ
jgi:hypothetical protein